MRKISIQAGNAGADPGKALRVQAEEKRLNELFVNADPNKQDFIRNHVQQLAWLNISIVELQKDIDEAGAVIEYNNGGNQKGLQQNPSCKLLIEYQKLSNTIIRTLISLVPNKLVYTKLADFFNCDDYEEDDEDYNERQRLLNAEIEKAVLKFKGKRNDG